MHFPNLPLYHQLNKDEFKELSDDQKNEFIEIMKKNEDSEKEEMILALIRAYHLDHDNIIQEIPYTGKLLKGGVKFDIDSIPSKLQYILYSFMKLI